MVKDKETSWALETEWDTTYQYGESHIDKRAVPFVAGKTPNLSISQRYSHFLPTDNSNLKLNINIEGIPNAYHNLTGSIDLHSGWK